MRNQSLISIIALLACLIAGVAPVHAEGKRMIVLGIDGMDPELLQGFMDRGLTPNLKKLSHDGGLKPLGTSIPPQSPVAWSNFITGMNPGGHGLFDFLALDRATMTPYLSSSKTIAPESDPVTIGSWQLPLGSGETVLMRKGTSFWEILDANSIPATMFRVPANYPPVSTKTGRSISGMGTPDIKGSSGTFSFFSNDPVIDYGTVSGGVITKVRVRHGAVETELEGPTNALRTDLRTSTTPVSVQLTENKQSATITVGGGVTELKVGDWSEWLPVEFELMPWVVSAPGMVRFYLQSADPYLRLYASPVNIDPRNPAVQIASPSEYGAEIAANAGLFYTQEMPEDTKALMAHFLSPEEFVDQSDLVLEERRRILDYELERFNSQSGEAFLFFYISSLDQRNHMLTRQMDTEHPMHDVNSSPEIKQGVQQIYIEADEIVGQVLDKMDEDTELIVMSDHGFASFSRQVNLNTWLEENGYLTLVDEAKRDEYEWLSGIDWSRTRAFSFGLNSLYLNVKDRERDGIVDPEKREALAREIRDKLAIWVDEENDQLVVSQPLLREEAYSGAYVEDAPDIIVGYSRGYRVSWSSAAGEIPAGLLSDNDKEWSGDHCMDSRAVPGVILSTLPMSDAEHDLRDLSATVLDYFDIEKPASIEGKSVY